MRLTVCEHCGTFLRDHGPSPSHCPLKSQGDTRLWSQVTIAVPDWAVRLLYTNHRGFTFWRLVEPLAIRYAESEWHPGKQWLLDAFDLVKQEPRTFAVKGIQRWETILSTGGI